MTLLGAKGSRPGFSATTANFQAAYPFLADGGLGAPGVYIGTDAYGGAWAFDPWELYQRELHGRKLMRSPNIIVLGSISNGKSTFIKTYLFRQHVFGRQAWVVDVKGEYDALGHALGHPPIRLSPGGDVRLNPISRRGGRERQLSLLRTVAKAALRRDLVPEEDAGLRVALDLVNGEATGEPTLPMIVDALLHPREVMVEGVSGVDAQTGLLIGRDGRAYVFSGTKFFTYSPENRAAGAAFPGLADGGPRPIAEYWAGLTEVSLAFVKVGMNTRWDATLRLDQIDYGGQPAGYVVDPQEVVNYIENHDNATLFDNNVYKLPTATSREDRARVQILGAAIDAFSQGVAYFHAGVDTLRSKSLDRNSYDSGDWFNRIDWRYRDNGFGSGLPPQGDNGNDWSIMAPLLANPQIKPTETEIAWTRDAFRDLMRIRAGTRLFHLRTADEIRQRLRFHNTGSAQVPTVLAGHLDGNGYAGANFREVLYFINVDKVAQALTIPEEAGKAYALHPVHLAANAADRRAAQATYDRTTGRFTLPPRTAVVFVVR